VTGMTGPRVMTAVQGFGAACLLEKPYDPKQLLTKIAQMLGDTTPPRLRPQVPLRAPRAEAPPRGGRKKILIVEDDRKIGLSLSLRLDSVGYEALLAQDALFGVTMAVKNQPDLVILDISMPAGDGFQVAERVRALVRLEMPIIFLTASKQPSFRAKATELGAAGFFEKPFKSHELLAAIEAALVQQA
jgi:CheY-like chemotaxis protein